MMARLAARLAQSVAVLALLSVAIYGLIGLMPGDPVDLLVASDPRMSPQVAAELRAAYGLDRPLLDRYGLWLGRALEGDFGYSRSFAQPVFDVLWPRLANTLVLVGIALALAFIVAIGLALLAARQPGGVVDRAVNLFCFAGVSMPPFWLALLLILLFAVELRWLPTGGAGPIGGTGGLAERLPYLVMPVLTLMLLFLAQYVRQLRAGLIDALRQDWARTARAKGASRGRVAWHHALRHAMLPVVTLLALDVGGLVGGALVTETMFAYPGMGKLIFDAIMTNDYNLALAALLVVAGAVMVGNLLADLALPMIDPRVQAVGPA